MVVVLGLGLVGCGQVPPDQVRPVFAQCADLCYQPCVAADGDTGVRWEGAPTDPAAWDVLGEQVTEQLAAKLRSCDVRRRACVQCLERLDAQGVIRQ